MFVADANTGSIYHFDLNENRTSLILQGALKDKVANSFEKSKSVIFANGFGRIIDMKIGADGYLYVLSSEADCFLFISWIYSLGATSLIQVFGS
jgi:aldose sugar dehydrogenase